MTEEAAENLNPKNRGLGRGLNALFEDGEDDVASAPAQGGDASGQGNGRRVLGIEKIEPNNWQPRKRFHENTIDELAESIKEHGVLQPLLVRPAPNSDDIYEIVAGERRWQAAQKAQIHELPVIILELDDAQAFEIALIENLQREDLNPVDEAAGYQKLLEEHGYTQEKLAKKMGKSRPHIANMTRLLALPESVQTYLAAGDITTGHARALITAKDPEGLAKAVVKGDLSVRQTEKLASEGSDRPKKASGPRPKKSGDESKGKDVDTLALEQEVSNALGMKVLIDTNGDSGTLKIQFKSLDQLDEVLHRLSHYPGSRLSG